MPVLVPVAVRRNRHLNCRCQIGTKGAGASSGQTSSALQVLVPNRQQRSRFRCQCRSGIFHYQSSTKCINASPSMPIAVLVYSLFSKRKSGIFPAFLISKITFSHTISNILPQLYFYKWTCQSFSRACYFLFPWRKF